MFNFFALTVMIYKYYSLPSSALRAHTSEVAGASHGSRARDGEGGLGGSKVWRIIDFWPSAFSI